VPLRPERRPRVAGVGEPEQESADEDDRAVTRDPGGQRSAPVRSERIPGPLGPGNGTTVNGLRLQAVRPGFLDAHAVQALSR
jgi:hypothetical protein